MTWEILIMHNSSAKMRLFPAECCTDNIINIIHLNPEGNPHEEKAKKTLKHFSWAIDVRSILKVVSVGKFAMRRRTTSETPGFAAMMVFPKRRKMEEWDLVDFVLNFSLDIVIAKANQIVRFLFVEFLFDSRSAVLSFCVRFAFSVPYFM